MQPGVPPQSPQPQYGAPPQQVIGEPATLVGQPTAGFGAPMQQVTQVMVSPGNGSATASMVLGIISMLLFLAGFLVGLTWCCSVPMSILGVVLGHVGYSNSKMSGVGGGEAVTGLVLNWIQVLAILALVLIIVIFGAAMISALEGY